MSAGDLALPVGHVAAPPVNLQVCLGRPFRQPVDLSDSNNYSPGLELWLHRDNSHCYLFAMFEGTLGFIPGSAAGVPHILELEIWHTTQTRYNQIPGLLEPVPYRVIYENVDEALVRTALRDLIQNAHAATVDIPNPNDWHPCMRQILTGNHRLKEQIDPEPEVIDNVVNAIMAPAAGVDPIRLRVVAGDHIGAAADPLPTNPRPDASDCPFVAMACRVTILIEEYAKNKLNPTYYLWRLLKNAYHPDVDQRKVQVVTHAPRRADNITFEHPLLDTIGMNLNNTVLPRVETNALMPGQDTPTDVILFPTGKLSEWNGVEFAEGQSLIEWRITNDANLQFETRLRAGVALAELEGVSVDASPGNQHGNLVQQVWNNWGAVLNDICTELQFPSELVAVTIAHETHNDERALAIESLTENMPQQLQAAEIPQAIIDAYIALTPRYNLTVPNPWQGNEHIPLPNGNPSNLTWNQLLDVVDVLPSRMSPGLTQTVVASAKRYIQWLGRWYPNVPATFAVTDPAAMPLPPGVPAGLRRPYFFWLLVGRHAILAGTAYHKYKYAYSESAMDLPKMAAMFNAGSLRYSVLKPDRDLVPSDQLRPNPWRMRYNNLAYPRDASRYYNAIQNLFGAGVNSEARFWRTLV